MSIREDIERPLTAYEELKAWCEKHLSPGDYEITQNRISLHNFEFDTILATDRTNIYFRNNGEVL